MLLLLVLFQAEDGIRDLVRSRGLGDVYKRQQRMSAGTGLTHSERNDDAENSSEPAHYIQMWVLPCLLYTSDAADERSSVDLGGRRIIKKKTHRGDIHRRDNASKHPEPSAQIHDIQSHVSLRITEMNM